MTLRNRGGIWHYRFKLDGKEYSGTTDLVATKQNMSKAQAIEASCRADVIPPCNRAGRLRPKLPVDIKELTP